MSSATTHSTAAVVLVADGEMPIVVRFVVPLVRRPKQGSAAPDQRLVRKWVVSGQRSIPAERSGAGMGCSGEVEYLRGSGSGLQGDFVAEGFELADVVALPTFWVDA